MRWTILGGALALALSLPATADQLLVERIQASEGRSAEAPDRGTTMARVRERLGEPGTVRGPVGEPPITRWVYDGVTVYFEHDRVIHSVERR